MRTYSSILGQFVLMALAISERKLPRQDGETLRTTADVATEKTFAIFANSLISHHQTRQGFESYINLAEQIPSFRIHQVLWWDLWNGTIEIDNSSDRRRLRRDQSAYSSTYYLLCVRLASCG